MNLKLRLSTLSKQSSMSKKITSIGYEIPGHSEGYANFGDESSLMEADIILISPKNIVPKDYGSISFSGGGWSYGIESSKEYTEHVKQLKKELTDHISAGGTVFVLKYVSRNNKLWYVPYPPTA